MAYIGKTPSSGIRNRFIYTATAGQTTFSGTDDHSRTLSYTDAEFTDVFLNGVKLDKSDYTATSGTSIVLDEGAAVDDILEVLAFDTFSVFSGEFSQDVTVGGATTLSGDLTVDTNTMFVDSTNNRVGINDATPSEELDINGDGSDVRIRMYDGAGASVGRIEHSGTNFDISNTATSSATMTFTTGSGSGAERMRINGSGNVGIGEPAPATRLEIKDTRPTLRLTSSQTGNWASGDDIARVSFFSDDTSGIGKHETGFILNESEAGGTSLSGALVFGSAEYNTAATERMRIDRSGNVLVGTTTAGISNSISTSIEASGLNNSRIYVNHSSSGSSNNSLYMGFGYGGNTIGSIRQNSTSSVSYLTTSDYRLKENAVAISDGITRVKSLQPKRFNFIADQSTTVDGFMAHEVATVVPEAIGGTHNEVETWTQDEIDAGDAPANVSAGDNKLDDDGNTIPIYQGIDQSKLVPLLTAALQEAIAKIETLETKVAALEASD